MRMRNRFPILLFVGLLAGAGVYTLSAIGRAGASAEDPSPAAPRAAERPEDGKLRIIVFGAHPDDCEIQAGGVAALWAKAGHHVKFVSLTNGDIGHWQMAGGPLAQRRAREVAEAARILGIETEVLDIHDGELMPTLENRRKVVRLIREWMADIAISHRPEDYHPDHRNTGLLVRDAAYMVIVPYFCPDTPYLEKNPVFLYSQDRFERPVPFRADVAVSIDSVVEKKLDALAAIESQFLEGGCCPSEKKMPDDREAGARRVRERFEARFAGIADLYRDRLVEIYGKDKGPAIQYAEAYELGEYGSRPSPDELLALFPTGR